MKKDLDYYLSLNYPIESYFGEHEIGDAYLVEYIDFDIKASSEDYEEAVLLAKEYLKKHLEKQLGLNNPIPNPNEGRRFMEHRAALEAYKNKDFKKAHDIWVEEAKLKNDQAMANLGLMYLKGEGVEKDYTKAKEWFEQASAYDNDSANFNLALMYQTKIGVEENIPKAIDYFRRAVAKNHVQAAFRLALIQLKDRTDLHGVKEGFDCMLKAAKAGHVMATVQLTGVDKPLEDGELNRNFRAKSLEDQLEILNDALERFIRPILKKDGGNIILLDYLNEPEIELRLAYQGACVGCSIASTGTYEMIKSTIEQVIDKKSKDLCIMKIAFASTDNIHVNQHFGWCKEFYIYEIIEDSYNFVKSVDSSIEISDEIEKLTYKIECLEDSDILYVQQIGPKASRMVQSCKIFPMQSSKENEKIEDILNLLIKMRSNPPIWMRRLLENES